MRRLVPLTLFVALLLVTVALVPIAAGADAGVTPSELFGETDGESTAADTQASANESEMSPGERLSGSLGVQRAELDGDVESRAFGLQIAAATSNETRAGLIADRMAREEQHLEEIQERIDALEEQREAGEITHGQYRAQMAQLATRLHNTEHLANESERVARGMPGAVLEARGVNVSAIEAVRHNASQIRGHEMSEIAREIGGPRMGGGPPTETVPRGGHHGEGPATDRGPDHAGPPEDRQENESDRGPPNESDPGTANESDR